MLLWATFCRIDAFQSSDQGRCSSKLLSAYAEGDVEEIKRVFFGALHILTLGKCRILYLIQWLSVFTVPLHIHMDWIYLDRRQTYT